MGIRENIRTYRDRARHSQPVEVGDSRLRGTWTVARSMFVMAMFDLNDALIERFAGDAPAVYDPADFPWIPQAEARVPEIREEIERYRATHDAMPQVAEISGLDPDADDLDEAMPPVSEGTWRAVILLTNGKWIDETADLFPAAKEAVSGCPQMTTVGFSALEPHSHIATHVGPNRGALRFQLPILVPGEPGDCRIRVGDEMVVWEEGKGVVFDLAVNHEAWNESDGFRVLLMIETVMPLPFPVSVFNRFVQWLYRFFPAYRDMPERVKELERKHLSKEELVAS